jgi:hypothetical protein
LGSAPGVAVSAGPKRPRSRGPQLLDDLLRRCRASFAPQLPFAVEHAGERHPHGRGPGFLFACEVAALARVRAQVVELGARGLDVLEAPLADHAQVAPAELQQRHERLGIGRGLVGLRRSAQGRGQAAAGERELPGRGETRQLEDRREDVDEPQRALEAAARRDAGCPHQERDPQGRLVDEEAVQALVVLAEALAVVGSDDERRVVSQPERAERVLEAAEELVGPGHLSVVGTARVARRVGFGRLVGVVRLVEVEPEKHATAGLFAEPLDRLSDRVFALFLDRVQELRVAAFAFEAVGVDVEAAVEAGLPLEHDRGDEGPGREAALAKELGQERNCGDHRRGDVVADGVLGGQEASEDRNVGGARERDVGRGLHGERALGGDAIETRRLDVARSVAAEAVGAQGVDRDDHDVARRLRRGGRALTGDEARGEAERQQPPHELQLESQGSLTDRVEK